MLRLFLSLIIAFTLTNARSKPNIQVFEIHDTDNGLQLKKLYYDTTNEDAQTQLYGLLSPKTSRIDSLTQQLLDKIRDIRGEDIYRFSDQPKVYVVGKDLEDDDETEELFDGTRHRPYQRNKDILLQLMTPESEKQERRLEIPVLRNKIDEIIDRTAAPRHKSVFDSDNNEDY